MMPRRADRPGPAEREGAWHLRPRGEAARCRACGAFHPESDLDDAGWCRTCNADLERRTRKAPRLIAAAIVLPFAVWVVLGGHFGVLPRYAWLLPLAAAYYLGLRIGREVMKGYARWRQTRVDVG
ncbi:MAG: hypothetical protein JSV95_04715 [Gemmatimonadota bacterium]|jgi:uncharacterized paraquat-inducible protein A|nr:MAG: hypothetical protein JSV95_04715 [Gemmatimonadota bacterium]